MANGDEVYLMNKRIGLLMILLFTISSSVNNYFPININATEGRIPFELYHIPNNLQKYIAGGYDYTFAVLQWFYAISEFGQLDKDEKTYNHLAMRLDTVTRLNPYAEHAYYMVATALPWATNSTRHSRPLLERAMKIMPVNWRWPFYRGFNAYWFDHDMKTAAKYMALAAGLPDAPPIVASLAARMHSEDGDLNTALAFLTNLYKNKQDPALKKQLENQIKAIQTEQILQRVDQLLAKTPAWQHGKRNLNTLGIHFPKTLPDGGHIILNAEGVPVSSISRKRFKVFVPPKRKKAQANELKSQ